MPGFVALVFVLSAPADDHPPAIADAKRYFRDHPDTCAVALGVVATGRRAIEKTDPGNREGAIIRVPRPSRRNDLHTAILCIRTRHDECRSEVFDLRSETWVFHHQLPEWPPYPAVCSETVIEAMLTKRNVRAKAGPIYGVTIGDVRTAFRALWGSVEIEALHAPPHWGVDELLVTMRETPVEKPAAPRTSLAGVWATACEVRDFGIRNFGSSREFTVFSDSSEGQRVGFVVEFSETRCLDASTTYLNRARFRVEHEREKRGQIEILIEEVQAMAHTKEASEANEAERHLGHASWPVGQPIDLPTILKPEERRRVDRFELLESDHPACEGRQCLRIKRANRPHSTILWPAELPAALAEGE